MTGIAGYKGKTQYQIIGINEEESKVNGIDQIFNKIMEETLPRIKYRQSHTDGSSTQNPS